MNLADALKRKNRLAGEVQRLEQILMRENSRRSDGASRVNRQEVWDQIIATSDQLAVLKAKIAEANGPIYVYLERMAEMKSRIAFLKKLNTREGKEIVSIGRDQEPLVYKWDAFINQGQVDELVVDLQRQIEAMQDACDSYNNKTEIDFS